MDWTESLQSLQTALAAAQTARAELEKFETQAVADIAKYARLSTGGQAGGIDLDVEAIKATVTRPYTLLPINEHEAHLIHWRGVRLPIFGWVLKQEPAFTIARVTRSMDLLTPLPAWMKSELGWKPPEHGAVIDGGRTHLRLTKGDEGTFKKKYGTHLGKQNADGSWNIKGGDAWIRLVAQLVRDGILPYAANPVAPEHWNARAELPPLLADIIAKKERAAGAPYIRRAVNEFHDKGAVLVNYPPGAGKTLTSCAILNHFVGRVLILADTTILIEQWRERVKLFAPSANVTISTYQGAAKYLDHEWDLIIPDEAQRLPANTFSKLAFAKTKYRLGLTGTPWREDDRQHLIVALAGFPIAIRWAELIKAGVLKRPRIIVVTVPNEAAKTLYVKQLIAKRKGRAIIFCDWIEQGNALANALDVPFIHGETRNKLARLNESEVAVVSRIADRGWDVHDLRLGIEVAGQGASREQLAQRLGRFLHSEFEGEFYILFTPAEALKFRARVFGVEAELAGEVDIEFITVGNVVEREPKAVTVRASASRSKSVKPAPAAAAKPQNEVDMVLANKAVQRALEAAYTAAGTRIRSERILDRILKLGWDAPISSELLVIGGQITKGRAWVYNSAFAIALAHKLMAQVGEGYQTNRAFLNQLVKASERFAK